MEKEKVKERAPQDDVSKLTTTLQGYLLVANDMSDEKLLHYIPETLPGEKVVYETLDSDLSLALRAAAYYVTKTADLHTLALMRPLTQDEHVAGHKYMAIGTAVANLFWAMMRERYDLEDLDSIGIRKTKEGGLVVVSPSRLDELNFGRHRHGEAQQMPREMDALLRKLFGIE